MLIAFTVDVFAQGIGVAPNKITIEAMQGEIVKRQLIVFNPSDEPIVFSLHSDLDWFSFHPKESLLQAEQSKKVIVEVNTKKSGEYSGVIYVQLKSGGNNNDSLALQLAAAVNIDLFVRSRQNKLIGAGVTALIVILGLVIYILSRR